VEGERETKGKGSGREGKGKGKGREGDGKGKGKIRGREGHGKGRGRVGKRKVGRCGYMDGDDGDVDEDLYRDGEWKWERNGNKNGSGNKLLTILQYCIYVPNPIRTL
jgi:hypothetical protein